MYNQSMPTIRVDDLCLGYQNKGDTVTIALNHLNAVFEDGLLHVIVGYSGCGKTTLLRCIAGLLPYDGHIFFDNVDVNDMPTKDRRISYVTQEYALYPHMTIFDNIAFPLKTMGAKGPEVRERVYSIAERFRIFDTLSRKPKQLSGGQQQRVALARALVKKPSVCLFDEPLSNLDEPNKNEIRRQIKETVHEYGSTAIYVTHSLSEAMYLADTLFVMNQGKISLSGSSRMVYDSSDPVMQSLKQGSSDHD